MTTTNDPRAILEQLRRPLECSVFGVPSEEVARLLGLLDAGLAAVDQLAADNAHLRLWHERIIEYWNCAEHELGYQPDWRLAALAMKQHSEEALGLPYSIVLSDATATPGPVEGE